MFGWFRRSPLISPEAADWQLETFAWLLRWTGGIEAQKNTPLVEPSDEYFPQRGLSGDALARALFEQVKVHAGMADWPCVLYSQAAAPQTLLAPTLAVQDAPRTPEGTFVHAHGTAFISYAPDAVQDPMGLVATFAHELAHYLIGGFGEGPPGRQGL
jgi:hypothetical protein